MLSVMEYFSFIVAPCVILILCTTGMVQNRPAPDDDFREGRDMDLEDDFEEEIFGGRTTPRRSHTDSA